MKWIDIVNYEGYYQVSNTGLVRSVDRVIMNVTKNGKPRPCNMKGKVLSQHRKKDTGRFQVAISKASKVKSHDVHVLVAEAFINKPNGDVEVNHIDGNRENNNANNLEWTTRMDNIHHAFSNEMYSTMKKVALLDGEGNIEKVFPSESSACRDMGVAQGKISRAIKRNGRSCGRRWKFVDEGVTTTETWTSPTE